MDIVKRIEYLKKLLNKNNYLYYIKQNPELSDSEYDTYFRELIELENLYPQYKDVDSPTHRIGAEPSNEFKTSSKLFHSSSSLCSYPSFPKKLVLLSGQ